MNTSKLRVQAVQAPQLLLLYGVSIRNMSSSNDWNIERLSLYPLWARVTNLAQQQANNFYYVGSNTEIEREDSPTPSNSLNSDVEDVDLQSISVAPNYVHQSALGPRTSQSELYSFLPPSMIRDQLLLPPSGRPHPPLNSGLQIRLMQLLPGSGRDPIQINLFNTVINGSPPYKAISYIWKEEREAEEKEITCNDQYMTIPKTLFEALHRFRRRNAKRTLWADSICINQRDGDEKGHQVGYMGLIFHSAVKVLSWIGQDEWNNTEQAFAFIEEVVSQCCRHNGSRGSAMISRSALRHLIRDRQSELRMYLKTVNAIIKRKYFKRVWILQEVSLAKDISLHCGSQEIQLSTLTAFCKIISMAKGLGLQIALNGHLNSLFDNLWCTFSISLPTWINNDPLLASLAQQTRTTALKTGYINDLVSLLSVTTKMQTTRPEDHIYSLLGHEWTAINAEGDRIVEAVYPITARQLNYNLARQMTEAGFSLSHLRAVHHWSDSSIESDQFPSWAPQWLGDISLPGMTRGFTDRSLKENAKTQFQANFDERGLLVYTTAIIIDQIDFFDSKSFNKRDNSDPSIPISNKTLFVDSWNSVASTTTRPVDDLVSIFVNHGRQDISYANCSTLMDLVKIMSHESPAASDIIQHRYSREIDQHIEKDIRGSTTAFSERLFKHFADRKFFTTAGGLIGLGPHLIRKGDRLCAFFGCDAIIAIRQSTSNASHHKVIGACTIAGLMEGAIGKAWRNGDLEQQALILA